MEMPNKHDLLADLISGRPLRRRDFLQRSAAFGIGVSGLGGLLAACGTDTSSVGGEGQEETPGRLVWANWPLSIDTDKDGNIPSLQRFEEETGIKVEYLAEINSNDEWFAKIQPLMKSGQGIEASLVSPTDWLAGRMIELGWAQELDRSKIPNEKNLLDAFASPPFDPDRKYTLPWQGWIAGIAVNTDVTGRDITSVEELLTAKDLAGKVSLLSEMRETTGLLMLANGADIANFTDADFQQALDQISSALKSGQLRKFTGNDYAPDLARGNIAACFAWAGDVVQLNRDNPAVKFFIPDTGAVLLEDVMMIPTDAPNKEGAEKLINFYFEPEIAAQVASYVNALCPVEGAQEAMKDVDPKLVDNELIFPDEESRQKLHGYMPLSADQAQKYQSEFDRVIGL
jgi:spermidine/putrescine transport system substrate-binding protein